MIYFLTGGTVITGAGMRRADVGVRGDKVADVAPDLPRDGARRVIDVTGRYVMPGVIDVHVHPVYLDDVEASARCAAYGGTTTVLHFAYARTGESLEEQVTKMLEDATRRSPHRLRAARRHVRSAEAGARNPTRHGARRPHVQVLPDLPQAGLVHRRLPADQGDGPARRARRHGDGARGERRRDRLPGGQVPEGAERVREILQRFPAGRAGGRGRLPGDLPGRGGRLPALHPARHRGPGAAAHPRRRRRRGARSTPRPARSTSR